MSQILPQDEAERLAFRYNPKVLTPDTSQVAKKFVETHERAPTDFKISPIVAEQAGVAAMQKKALEAQIEETVLERVREIQEEAYSTAYARGLAEGSERAFQEKSDEFVQRLGALDEVLANLRDAKKLVLKENEAAFVRMAFEIGKKIAWREISLSQEPVLNVMKDLIDSIKKDDKLVVRLSKADLKFIEDLKSKGAEQVEFLENIKLVASEGMEVGGCAVESNFGAIDASIGERVERIWGTLEARLPDLSGHKTNLGSDGDPS
jgi:flagellar assembly protein FliH